MGSKLGHLTAEERGAIEYGLSRKHKISAIALELNRHPSTIYREIKRNTYSQGKNAIYGAYPYQATNAGNLASLRKRKSHQPTKQQETILQTILVHLELKWSPEQIVNGLSGVSVSTKTIYNWIHQKILPFDRKKLRRKGKGYKEKETGTLLRRPDSDWLLQHSIELRPEEVNHRELFGHWEADSVLSGRKGSGAVASFLERKTRKYVTYKMARKTSQCMYEAFNQLLNDFKGCVHSVTCDRGTEFMNQEYVEQLEENNLEIYFAHPYSPHERGSNENHNGLLREYFPKGTDFGKVTQEKLTMATEAINQRPRKVLSWNTANNQFSVARN